MKYIGIGDFFLIAEGALGESAQALNRETDLGRLLSALGPPKERIDGVDLYPTLDEKAAILCIRIARNRPLRHGGNSAVAFAAMREFIARNGASWTPKHEDAAVVKAMAAGRISEIEFILWVNRRMT